MGKNRRPLWNDTYLALILEAIVCYTWFTGHLLLIGTWFILG